MGPAAPSLASALTVASFLFLAAGVSHADTLYISSKSAQVRAGTTSLDDVKGTVHYGDAVESLRTDNAWAEVKTKNGIRGWIHTSKLSNTPPTTQQDTSFLKLGSTSNASTPTVTAGARGLDKVAQGYADKTGISPQSREVVDQMTNYQVNDSQVENFLKEGGLGDYAK